MKLDEMYIKRDLTVVTYKKLIVSSIIIIDETINFLQVTGKYFYHAVCLFVSKGGDLIITQMN